MDLKRAQDPHKFISGTHQSHQVPWTWHQSLNPKAQPEMTQSAIGILVCCTIYDFLLNWELSLKTCFKCECLFTSDSALTEKTEQFSSASLEDSQNIHEINDSYIEHFFKPSLFKCVYMLHQIYQTNTIILKASNTQQRIDIHKYKWCISTICLYIQPYIYYIHYSCWIWELIATKHSVLLYSFPKAKEKCLIKCRERLSHKCNSVCLFVLRYLHQYTDRRLWWGISAILEEVFTS